MNQFKKGTPAYGLALGTLCVLAGILLLTIGFWKTLLLAALFAAGYFFGTVENKGDFIREAANRVIPKKETEVIDFRSEISREQEQQTEQTDSSAESGNSSEAQEE